MVEEMEGRGVVAVVHVVFVQLVTWPTIVVRDLRKENVWTETSSLFCCCCFLHKAQAINIWHILLIVDYMYLLFTVVFVLLCCVFVKKKWNVLVSFCKKFYICYHASFLYEYGFSCIHTCTYVDLKDYVSFGIFCFCFVTLLTRWWLCLHAKLLLVSDFLWCFRRMGDLVIFVDMSLSFFHGH